jgi:hypothetical protein
MTNVNLFDHYSFRARLQPALLTLLPAAIGLFAWTGPDMNCQTVLWTLFGSAGGTYFLAIVARNSGKRIESDLWQDWGGAPTTQLLRYCGLGNPVMRERWRKYLSKLLKKPLPTQREEADNPDGADDVYHAATRVLINQTRDKKRFPLVYMENVHYGFCRNLYAMRGVGITLSVLGILASFAAGVWSVHRSDPKVYPWACLIVEIMLLAWWLIAIRATWARVPAFAYAERLLESTEDLSRPQSKT